MRVPRHLSRVGLLVVTLIVPPLGADEDAPAVSGAVAEVVRMLDAKISEAIVLRWLDSRKAWPDELSADDLIALTGSGASDELMERFLDELPGEQPIAPAPRTPGDQEVAPAGDQPPRPAGPSVDATFSLLHRRTFTSETEDDWQDDQVPDMYVYLDGELVGWLEPRARKSPTRVSQTLTPGAHSLLVTLEAHEKRRGRWKHRTQVSPERWSFELEPGGQAELSIEFEDSWGYRKGAGPLSVRVEQNGGALLEEARTGGDPEDWPYLCDDIEAGIKEGNSPSPQARTYLRNCVEWSSVWTATAVSRERDEVLDDLAGTGFRPDFGAD